MDVYGNPYSFTAKHSLHQAGTVAPVRSPRCIGREGLKPGSVFCYEIGKNHGKAWENNGKSWGKHGIIIANSWDNHGT